jgi:transposase-like protein
VGSGVGGFLPALIKAVLERGLHAELADHLGYDKGHPAGRGSPNSRNGSTPKTVATEVGDIALDSPRDRNSSFEPASLAQRRMPAPATATPTESPSSSPPTSRVRAQTPDPTIEDFTDNSDSTQ